MGASNTLLEQRRRAPGEARFLCGGRGRGGGGGGRSARWAAARAPRVGMAWEREGRAPPQAATPKGEAVASAAEVRSGWRRHGDCAGRVVADVRTRSRRAGGLARRQLLYITSCSRRVVDGSRDGGMLDGNVYRYYILERYDLSFRYVGHSQRRHIALPPRTSAASS